MNPRIRYATTEDAISIAWWRIGEGTPLVMPPPALPWSHIQLELGISEWQHWYEHLSRQFEIIRYDNRGAGLSDRDISECSLEANIRDLEAVIDATGAERVALFGLYYSGVIAMEYAARHPERVSHLILWCAFAREADRREADETHEAIEKLMDLNYQLFTETLAHTVFGWSEGDRAHQLAEYMQASADPVIVRMSWNSERDIDVTPLLPKITCPTLILHRRQFPMLDVGAAKTLAAGIPNSRVVMLDGASLAPYLGDSESGMRAMIQFLGGDASMLRELEHAHLNSSAGFRAIMFTDIEDSTATTQRLGDTQAQAILHAHNQVVRDALHSYGGDEVKHTGDGIMAAFTSATLAVECAIEIQRTLAERHDSNGSHPHLHVRIGLNAGEPVIEGGDLFGTAVQLASRVSTRAGPEQILVTDVVRQLVAGKGFLFADGGETDLRGFEEPVRLYEVLWRPPEA